MTETVSYMSDADRAMLLDRAVAEYVAKGWEVDDRTETRAVVSKEWGPRYALSALTVVATFGMSAIAPGKRKFKRRVIAVARNGAVSVDKAPPRGTTRSRYDSWSSE
jgi:hypothetical protein